jgi:hypothetical protein
LVFSKNFMVRRFRATPTPIELCGEWYGRSDG